MIRLENRLINTRILNKYGLFFPVFLQEMVFLGDKVFAELASTKITEEVSMFVLFWINIVKEREGKRHKKINLMVNLLVLP